MVETHLLKKLVFKGNEMILVFEDAKYKVDFTKLSSKLKNATEIERQIYSISPSGYGIHWQAIDEDLAVNILLNSEFTSIIK